MKFPQKPIPRVSPKKASKGFQWSTAERSRVKKKPRKPSETLRIYGPPARRRWMKTLPCSACQLVGYSDGAHVLGNGGMGRKADADTQAPLCHAPRWRWDGTRFIGKIGCHQLFDEHRSVFDSLYPFFSPEKAAAETQAAWIAHSQEKA